MKSTIFKTSRQTDVLTSLRAPAKNVVLTLLFASLMVLSAYIRIPVPGTPVPITLQVLVVLVAAPMIGALRGTFSQALYVTLGALGLPVFTGGAGLAYVFGPTGGYLLSFVFAPYLIAAIAGRSFNSLPRVSLSFIAGVVFIHCCGVIWLSLYTAASLKAAFMMGSMPFIGWDLMKTAMALATLNLIRRVRR